MAGRAAGRECGTFWQLHGKKEKASKREEQACLARGERGLAEEETCCRAEAGCWRRDWMGCCLRAEPADLLAFWCSDVGWQELVHGKSRTGAWQLEQLIA